MFGSPTRMSAPARRQVDGISVIGALTRRRPQPSPTFARRATAPAFRPRTTAIAGRGPALGWAAPIRPPTDHSSLKTPAWARKLELTGCPVSPCDMCCFLRCQPRTGWARWLLRMRRASVASVIMAEPALAAAERWTACSPRMISNGSCQLFQCQPSYSLEMAPE